MEVVFTTSTPFKPIDILPTIMRKKIMSVAEKKFKILRKKYDKFVCVFVDNWRGYCFIFDTEDVRNCRNDCANCDLFKLLKNEKGGVFSGKLNPASIEDKKIFGPQNFLNCKTLEQYINCYANFLIQKTKTKKDILVELNLIKEAAIIYAKGENKLAIENKFRQSVIQTAKKNTAGKKKQFIAEITSGWPQLQV